MFYFQPRIFFSFGKQNKTKMRKRKIAVCKRCRLRARIQHYEACLQCAAKKSRVSSTNISEISEQANAVERPIRASKRLRFGSEIDDESLVFTRGADRYVRIRGLSFRVDRLQFFDISDLKDEMTTHDLGHGLVALIDCQRKCLTYYGDMEVAPVLERAVFALPCTNEERRFVCSTSGRGVVQFKFPGFGVLPEVYQERLRIAKCKEYMKVCRTCQQTKPCYEFRWKESSKSSNYERRCRACVTLRRFVYKAANSSASPSTSDTASIE